MKLYVLVTAIDNPRPNSKPNCFHGRLFCSRQKTRNGTHDRHIVRYLRILYAPVGVVRPRTATPAVLVTRYKVVVCRGCAYVPVTGQFVFCARRTVGAKYGQTRMTNDFLLLFLFSFSSTYRFTADRLNPTQ